MVYAAKRDSDDPAGIYTSPTAPSFSSTAGWFGPTQFVQPLESGPQPHIPNSQWMTGPASTQAATIFAPQGHTMHQPPMQGHYDVPAPMQLGHTASTPHHGHLIPPQAPPPQLQQQLQPPQPQPTAFMPTQTPQVPAPATALNPTPPHAFISQQQQHQPPPPQQQQQPPTQASFTLPTTLTPTTATPQPCTTPMQTASPAPVSATPPQQPPTTSQPPQQPQSLDNLPPQLAQLQSTQGAAPAPATGGTSPTVTTDPDQRGPLPRPHRRSHSRRPEPAETHPINSTLYTKQNSRTAH